MIANNNNNAQSRLTLNHRKISFSPKTRKEANSLVVFKQGGEYRRLFLSWLQAHSENAMVKGPLTFSSGKTEKRMLILLVNSLFHM